MPRSFNETEKANMKRLESNYPRLKHDPKHRGAFHDYLNSAFIRNVDKPITYAEFEEAYKQFIK